MVPTTDKNSEINVGEIILYRADELTTFSPIFFTECRSFVVSFSSRFSFDGFTSFLEKQVEWEAPVDPLLNPFFFADLTKLERRMY